MSLITPVTGGQINASDVAQLVQVLQKAAGQTEAGKYYFTFWAAANADTAGAYCSSQSRGSVPVSVTIDHADAFPSGVNAPAASNLTAFGFEVYCAATTAGVNYGVGGNWTIQY